MNDPNLRPKNHTKDDADNSNNLISNFVEKTHKVAGVEKLEGFSLGEIFSEIFRKRSEKEVEEYSRFAHFFWRSEKMPSAFSIVCSQK